MNTASPETQAFPHFFSTPTWGTIEDASWDAERLDIARRNGRALIVPSWVHTPFVARCVPPLDASDGRSTEHSPLIKRLVFDMLARSPRFDPNEPIPGEAVRSVLLFRYDAIGDYIVTTPLVEWLRRALPQAHVTVLSSTRNERLIEQDPHIARTVAIHPRHGFHISWLRAIARLGGDYDVVFALMFTRMTKAALLARAIAPEAELVAPWHHERAALYGKVFHRQPRHYPGREHWSQTLLRMGQETIAPATSIEQTPRQYVPLAPGACRKVWQWSSARGLGTVQPAVPLCWARDAEPIAWQMLSGNPYAVVNLSAYSPNRRWQPDHAQSVLQQLLDCFPHMAFVVTAAPSQWDEARLVVERLAHPRCHVFFGSVEELVALVAGSAWVLSPDTAAIHIAAALGKPVVGLYAELIKVAEWYPFGVPFVVVLSPSEESICRIPPLAVVEACLRVC
ncbi:MAG: hypothetical protein N3B17_08790 [Chlorobi bacterium]|jgi:ADP-heptose:LPS heptosyltransferase|nr:hypothetical protein [Chlorobiota bacterium]